MRFASSLAVLAALASQSAPAQPAPTVRSLLQAYWDGDVDVIRRHFARGRDLEPMLPVLRAWIEAEASESWPVATSILLLDLADAAAGQPEASPQAALQLIDWARGQITSRRAERDPLQAAEIERLVHQTAVALLQGLGAGQAQRRYLNAISHRYSGGLPPRLSIALGLATLPPPVRAPGRAAPSEDAADEAIRAYDRAARDPSARAEASARAAAVYLSLDRPRDALRRLDVAGEAAEVAVAAWIAHLRGRALGALGETAAAGFSVEVARGLGQAGEVWLVLDRGDHRFVAEWLSVLKASLGTAARSRARSSTAAGVLDRYAARQYEAVALDLVALESLEKFSKDFRESADRWIAEAGPARVDRRALVVVLVALEAARARGGVEWGEAQLLVEWACARLRAATAPTDVERDWMWAAAALMEGVTAGAALEVHVMHALKRFPDDPALTMARAVAAELRAGPDSRSAWGLRATGSLLEHEVAGYESALDRARRRFDELTAVPEYRAEASLRLGYTALRLGRHDDALRHLARAADLAGSDEYVAHLAHLFRGRALDWLERRDEAVAAYRAAASLEPGAQTAELALAAALARAGHRTEAAAVADRALASTDGGRDPWLSYGQGDLRKWPLLVARLRSAVE